MPNRILRDWTDLPEPHKLQSVESVLRVRRFLPKKVPAGHRLQSYKHRLSQRLRHLRGKAGPPLLNKTVRELLENAGSSCPLCGIAYGPKVGPSIDHISPISKGGTNEKVNLRVICISCNAKKGDRIA